MRVSKKLNFLAGIPVNYLVLYTNIGVELCILNIFVALLMENKCFLRIFNSKEGNFRCHFPQIYYLAFQYKIKNKINLVCIDWNIYNLMQRMEWM